jgi:hypothetical protein
MYAHFDKIGINKIGIKYSGCRPNLNFLFDIKRSSPDRGVNKGHEYGNVSIKSKSQKYFTILNCKNIRQYSSWGSSIK